MREEFVIKTSKTDNIKLSLMYRIPFFLSMLLFVLTGISSWVSCLTINGATLPYLVFSGCVQVVVGWQYPIIPSISRTRARPFVTRQQYREIL